MISMNRKIKHHKEITDRIRNTYKRKNKDYGDSFSKSYNEFGAVAGVIRISDKVERLKNLVRSDERHVEDETFKDTLEDMIGYGIMLLMEIENDNVEKELEK